MQDHLFSNQNTLINTLYTDHIHIQREGKKACMQKHSERGGQDKSITDVTARLSHRPEQQEEEEEGLEKRYRDPPIGQ